MQDLIPKMSGGYMGVRLTPPLNNIFPKPPPVPPPPEKYYAATQICTSKSGTMNMNGHILSNTMNHNANNLKNLSNTMNTKNSNNNINNTLNNNINSNTNGSNTGTTASLDGRVGGNTPTTPSNQLNSYSDFDTLLLDDDIQLKEFPRDKLVIVEKLGCGMFGELHLCEIKGQRLVHPNSFLFDFIFSFYLVLLCKNTSGYFFEKLLLLVSRQRRYLFYITGGLWHFKVQFLVGYPGILFKKLFERSLNTEELFACIFFTF